MIKIKERTVTDFTDNELFEFVDNGMLKKLMQIQPLKAKKNYTQKFVKMKSEDKLKRIAELLGMIGLCMGQLHKEFVLNEFAEIVFGESKINLAEATKNKVNAVIKRKYEEIVEYVAELEAIELTFIQEDVYPKTHIEKQKHLNKAMVGLRGIKEILMEFWAERKLCKNEDDTIMVKALVLRVFRVVTIKINRVCDYVSSYNKTSDRKLNFTASWGAFLKGVPRP